MTTNKRPTPTPTTPTPQKKGGGGGGRANKKRTDKATHFQQTRLGCGVRVGDVWFMQRDTGTIACI